MWNLSASMPTYGYGCCEQDGQPCHYQDHFEHTPNVQSCSPYHYDSLNFSEVGNFSSSVDSPIRNYHRSDFSTKNFSNNVYGQPHDNSYGQNYEKHSPNMNSIGYHEAYPSYQEEFNSFQQVVPNFDPCQNVERMDENKNMTMADSHRQLLEHVIGRHVKAQDNCGACKLMSDDGSEQVISLNDLVEIVAKTMESVQEKLPQNEKTSKAEKSSIGLHKKRMQNKEAAARYRQKQKSKLLLMQEEIVLLEEKRSRLQAHVDELAEKIKKHRQILDLK